MKSYVVTATLNLSLGRYAQEPGYTAALLGRLDGTAYEGADGYVRFLSTVVTSSGPGSAEALSGADLAITAEVSDGERSVSKAILAQAKLGSLDAMPPHLRRQLENQIRKMRKLTRSPKVLTIENIDDRRVPRMLSGNKILAGEPQQGLELADYFVRRVLTTFDGDTRDDFVARVQDSRLNRLQVDARTVPAA